MLNKTNSYLNDDILWQIRIKNVTFMSFDLLLVFLNYFSLLNIIFRIFIDS